MSIYDKIKQLCKEKGVTVTGTEKELGFSRGSLCKIDKNKPSSEKLQKLADYFEVQLEYLRILKGDVVIVREQNDAESGDVVIVTINGDEATCKRLMKYADGISLISFNPAYEPMTFSNKEIEEKPVRIIGKVIENRSRF